MSKNLRDFTKAVYGFDHVMRGVRVTMWDNATPCEEWSARDVAGHVTGVIEMVGAQACGRRPAHDFMRAPGEIVGDDPYRSWYQVKEATLEALDRLGALERLAYTPKGRQPVDELIGDTVVDTIVHTWDLAARRERGRATRRRPCSRRSRHCRAVGANAVEHSVLQGTAENSANRERTRETPRAHRSQPTPRQQVIPIRRGRGWWTTRP